MAGPRNAVSARSDAELEHLLDDPTVSDQDRAIAEAELRRRWDAELLGTDAGAPDGRDEAQPTTPSGPAPTPTVAVSVPPPRSDPARPADRPPPPARNTPPEGPTTHARRDGEPSQFVPARPVRPSGPSAGRVIVGLLVGAAVGYLAARYLVLPAAIASRIVTTRSAAQTTEWVAGAGVALLIALVIGHRRALRIVCGIVAGAVAGVLAAVATAAVLSANGARGAAAVVPLVVGLAVWITVAVAIGRSG